MAPGCSKVRNIRPFFLCGYRLFGDTGPMAFDACRNHPDTAAAWRCVSCGGLFCDQCINVQSVGLAQLDICRSCRGKCEPFGAAAAAIEAAKPKERSFFAQIPGAFVYPCKGMGFILLLTGAMFFWLIKLATISVFGTFTVLFAGGYLAAYMLRIISHTADGGEELPDWPNFADFWEDIILPFFLIVGLNAFCFLPAIAYFLVTAYYDVFRPVICVALIVAGLFYLPMGLLGLGIFDSMAGMSPLRVLPAIPKTLGAYLVAWAILLAVGGLQVAAEALLPLLRVPLLGPAIAGILSFYLLAVEMRVLGLLYRVYEKRLGWLEGI
jgi:hypothetical protein